MAPDDAGLIEERIMSRRQFVGVLIAVSLAFAVAVAAPYRAPSISASGGGTLDARGTGMLELRGAIDATITARYPIMLTRDFSGDAAISIPGTTDRVSFFGFTVYFSAQSAHVAGSDVEFVVIGKEIVANGSGTGWAYFEGTGSYAADGRPSTSWDSDRGTAVALGAGPLRGDGLFVAHGAGVVAVRGTVAYRSATSAGVLLVKDIADNATIHVSGGVKGEYFGFTTYAGFSSAAISGADVGMVVAGADINVTATGTGLGYVLGDGAYSLNSGPSNPWTIEGHFADIAP
jgi:hypothetical protein